MIWWTLVFWLASYIISYALRPKMDIENARASKLNSINFPRASASTPVPVIFGKVRLRSPNTLWFGNFKAVPQTVKVKTGMFSSKDQITGYSYCVSMDLAICQGPGVILYRAWADKKLWLDRSGTPISGDGITATINQANLFGGSQKGGGLAGVIRWYSGAFSQTRNAFISARATNGADLPAYTGICHVVFENRTYSYKIFGQTYTVVTPFYIGTQAALKAMNFEVGRYPDALGLGANRLIGEDLNPAEIIYSLLTSDWGGLGLSTSLIDTASFTAAGTTLFTEGNGASLIIDSPNDVKSVISELLRQVDGIMFQDPSTGKLSLKLIRNDYVIGSLPVFDESVIESDGVEVFARSSWADTNNQVRVIYNSRDKLYNEATAFVQDLAGVSMQGRIKSMDLSFPTVTTEANALSIATRELSQVSVPLYRATLRTNRLAASLKPGDPFVFAWTKYGITQAVMRVSKFDAGELVSGAVRLECVQDKFAAANVLYAAPSAGLDDPGTVDAVNITKYGVFETPYILIHRLASPFAVTADSGYLTALARDPTLKHDGYDLVTSDDNYADKIITEINHTIFPLSAELVGSLFKEMGMATGTVGKITIRNPDPPNTAFSTQSAADIRVIGKGIICIVSAAGIEFAGYEGYTDNGDGTWSLDTVHRALLDTKFEDHIDGDIVYFLTGVEWLSQYAWPDTGTIKYELLTFTATDAQDLHDFTAQTLVFNNRYDKPLPPDYLEVSSVRNPIEVLSVSSVNITAFLERNRLTVDEFTIIDDSTDSPEASTTYNARLYLDSSLLASSSALTHAGLPFALSGLSGSGVARIELEAVRSGLISWTPDFIEFFYANYQSLSAERLTNPGFESGLTGWTNVSGSWSAVATAWPLDPLRTVGAASDANHLESTGTTNERRQDYTLAAGDLGKSSILRAYRGGKGTATSQIIVELRNGGGALTTVTIPAVAPANIGKWELLEIPLPVRSDATIVRVRAIAAATGAILDNISYKNHTVGASSTLSYPAITGVTAKGCWGLRKMVAAYAGSLVRVRDTFDDTEQDVGFDIDGNLAPFYVRGKAAVVRLYDQSGNGANLEAASNAKQPRLFWNLTETGRPYIDFFGGKHLRDTTAATNRPYMTTRPNMVMALGPMRDSNASYLATIPHQDASHSSPFYRWGLRTTGTDYRWSIDGTEDSDAGNSAINAGKHTVWIDYQNGNLYENDDATAADTFAAANITYPNSTRLRIGEDGGGTNPWTGSFSELCIFDGNIANADRKTIMEALALYWYNMAI